MELEFRVPFAINEKIYVITDSLDIICCMICGYTIFGDDMTLIRSCETGPIDTREVGFTVFGTREQAEAKLKELEK